MKPSEFLMAFLCIIFRCYVLVEAYGICLYKKAGFSPLLLNMMINVEYIFWLKKGFQKYQQPGSVFIA